MKIFVRAKPNSKNEKVEKINDAHFSASVKEPPQEGKANEAISGALARHFRVARSQIRLVSGHSSRQKVFEIKERPKNNSIDG